MVFFVCSNCGASLKKNQVEKHTFGCRSSSFSCIDCNKDFYGDDYKSHTKCITELERYSAKGWKPPANHNKGEKKQSEWVDIVQGALEKHASSINPAARNLLHIVSKHDNVPRKKPKFLNFINNICRRGFNEGTINEVWMILEGEWKASKESVAPPLTESKEKSNEGLLDIQEETEMKPKKKKKKAARESDEITTDIYDIEGVETEEIPRKKKRKKAKAIIQEEVEAEEPMNIEDCVADADAEANAIPKKKKKHKN